MAARSTIVATILAATVLMIAPLSAQEPQAPAEPPGLSESAARERAALFAELANAKTEPEAREIEERLWNFWFKAPDAESQRLMNETKKAMVKSDYGGALTLLNQVIEHVPDYAEAWNQRATILFLTGAYYDSLVAIEETLKREPKHYGALAGRGIILLYFLGREAEAQVALKQALKINPWLKERRLIKEEPGRKI